MNVKRFTLLFFSFFMISCGTSATSSSLSSSSSQSEEQMSSQSSSLECEKLDPIITTQKTAFKKDNLLRIDDGPLPYRLYVPNNYDGDTYQYPMFIFLHGAGERGNDNVLQLENVVQNLFNDLDSPLYQSIAFFPQCPAETDTSDADMNQWVDTPWANGNYSVADVPESNDIKAVLQIIEDLKERYSINNNRVYVMGLSMGGFGTWNLLMNHTELFAGAVPVCGGADVTYADKLKDMPIYTIHGTADTTVPCKGTREMVKAIKEAGSRSIIYDELKNFGHNVWDYASTRNGIIDWLFAQNRKNHTDVANDGIKKYEFEGEAAELEVVNKNWAVRTGNTAAYNSGESGTGYLGNWNSKGDKIIFNITSDRAAKAKLSLRMGVHTNGDYLVYSKSGDSLFSSLTLNGNNVTLDSSLCYLKSGVSPDWYLWEEKDIAEVNLTQGENKFVFTTNGAFLHWDQLALTTSANLILTSEKDVGHNFSDWVVTNGDNNNVGRLYRYCSTCCIEEEIDVPKFSSPEYTIKTTRAANGYVGGITTYSYKGHTFNIKTQSTGTLVDNKIEAESATITGPWDASRIVNSYNSPVVHLQLNERKAQLRYTFNSSEEATANFIINIAAHNQYNLHVSDSLKFTINGKPFAIKDTDVISADSSGWHSFRDYEVGLVDLKKGENTLIVDVLGNFNFNLDYINFKSAAIIV